MDTIIHWLSFYIFFTGGLSVGMAVALIVHLLFTYKM